MFWNIYKQIFDGPTDDDTEQKVLFPEQLDDVQFIKILPVDFNEKPSLRLEILGCVKESKFITTYLPLNKLGRPGH